MRVAQVALLFVLVFFLSGCSSGLDLTKASTQLDVGVRAARENLWREALFRFQRAVQIDPASAMAQNNLAVAYEGIGEFEKAREAYSEALRLDRSNQYIQKNYSRFVEFYTKNRRRERGLPQREEAPAAEAPAAAPESGIPPTQPGEVPTAQPDAPKEPVVTPPATTQPDKPPLGGRN